MAISIAQTGDQWQDPNGVEVLITKRDRVNNLVQIAGGNWTSENLASQGYTFLSRAAPAQSTDTRLDKIEARLSAAGIP